MNITIDKLNHELFLEGKSNLLQVAVSVEGTCIDLWCVKSGDLLNSFEDCDEAISAIQKI
tara:strand:- start:496 stop:675 length:180 start_codon:yes stop_codon:yes gene_type:complete